jgi:delta14-sterol reductase
MSWSYSLPTGIAGYIIQHRSPASIDGAQSPAGGSFIGGRVVGTEVVQGEARGWGMIITYFYVVYFAVLLIHREMRDEEKCLRKYGEDWLKYRKLVPYKIIPGIY